MLSTRWIAWLACSVAVVGTGFGNPLDWKESLQAGLLNTMQDTLPKLKYCCEARSQSRDGKEEQLKLLRPSTASETYI